MHNDAVTGTWALRECTANEGGKEMLQDVLVSVIGY